MADDYSGPKEKSATYWQRETTANGQKINDALDKHEESVAWKTVSKLPDADRLQFYDDQKQARIEKAEWRATLARTGKLITPAELVELEIKDSEKQSAAADRAWNSGPSGEYVTLIKSGTWTVANGGGAETKTDIGRSVLGFHYANNYTTPSYDGEKGSAGWSKPFATQELAERVAFAAKMGSVGDTSHFADGPQITQAMRDQARGTVEARGAYADNITAQRRQQSVSEQDRGMER